MKVIRYTVSVLTVALLLSQMGFAKNCKDMQKGTERIGSLVNSGGTVKIIRETLISKGSQVVRGDEKSTRGVDNWGTEYCVSNAISGGEPQLYDVYKNDYVHAGTQGAQQNEVVATITYTGPENVEIAKVELFRGTFVYLGKIIDVQNVNQNTAYTIPNLTVYEGTTEADDGQTEVIAEADRLYVQLVTGKATFNSQPSRYTVFAYTPHLLAKGRSFAIETLKKDMVTEDEEKPMNSKILAKIERMDEAPELIIIPNGQKTLITRKVGFEGKNEIVVYAKLQPNKVVYPQVEIFADDTSLKSLKSMAHKAKQNIFKKDTGKRSTQVVIDF